ncbi:MAG: hypothetical protein L6Q95_05895 [Planctomycetes bacterium]|nr:hypothetical protein [Planctomycetota bacterium]
MGNWLGRFFSLSLAVLALAWAAPAAQAEDVFLIISMEPEFDTSVDLIEDFGSPTIIVRIGSLTNDVPDPRQTRFLPGSEPPTVPVGEDNLTAFDGNESTIFGSYTVEDFESTEPHMVTPGAAGIDPQIQAAVFASSSALATAVTNSGGFMSTGDIVEIVYEKAVELAGEGEYTGPDPNDIAEALFGATQPLSAPDDFSCEAEGELFPHPKDEVNPLFAFEIAFDDEGTFTSLGVCLLVEAEVKESSVNLKKKGTVSVAIYSSDTFDSDDIDEDTVEIGGVLAGKVQFAKNKATAQFSVKDLVDAGVLTSDTEEITIHADLTDGSCIEATIPINVK